MIVGLRGTCADTNIVLRACQQAGFEPRIAYTSDDYFAIQGLVASGMGVALVPGLGARQHARRRRRAAAARAARPTAASAPSSPPTPRAGHGHARLPARRGRRVQARRADLRRRCLSLGCPAGDCSTGWPVGQGPSLVGRKREVRRRGWGTAATPFDHVAFGLATAGGGRGAGRGRSWEAVWPILGLRLYVGGTTGILPSPRGCPRYGPPSMSVWETEPPADRLAGSMSTPVIACLHNLEDAFTGHAGCAIRAACVELDERRPARRGAAAGARRGRRSALARRRAVGARHRGRPGAHAPRRR